MIQIPDKLSHLDLKYASFKVVSHVNILSFCFFPRSPHNSVVWFPYNPVFQSGIENLPLASRMQPTCIHLVGDNWNLVSHCSSGNCLASHLVLYSERLHSLHHMLLYVRFLLLKKTTNII